jgi:hypothetical protein
MNLTEPFDKRQMVKIKQELDHETSTEILLAFMSEQPPTGNVVTHSFANKALLAAAIIGCLSIFVPGIVWRMGRWDVIFASSGVFCFGSLVVFLCGILAIRRGPRGFRPYAAAVIGALALLFWCLMIFVFISLSHGGGE